MRRGKGGKGGLLPSSLRIISSCLKTVSSNAGTVASTVRSAGASVAASIAVSPDDVRDQIYCFDAVTLENKFSVLTFPFQGSVGVNIGYGPMAVGPRWLAYSPNNPLLSNTGRLSPQNLTPSPGVSPSTSPGNGTLVARYAMESSKQLAAGIFSLGDMGYKTFSKYCNEFLPDGSSSPLSANSSRRIGKVPSSVHPSESENAGMVVVKDFITKDVISQFRAHTSPISALCFDPSGTLLVTASVQGHNINVFRIMPGSTSNGSSTGRYDWTSSHTHLYKLYRGITAAVIQDICFSHYSQWVAIVSSRGTCHIFVLSPFGGDSSLQPQSTDSDGPILVPNLSPPWWTTSSYMMDKQCFPPPSLTLSVVSRIKGGNFGWLNTVSNVAASAAGKTTAPSGAIAAVFHNSIFHGTSPINWKSGTLEHLLVYSPSGHVIQHELQPASSAESSDSSSRNGSGSLQLQDEELHVIAEPVQWWDVCRRANWLEREHNMSRIKFVNQQNLETVMDSLDSEDSISSHSMSSSNDMAGKDSIKPHERHNWYLSNAEVQNNSGRIPIWQKSKICFYVMESLKADGVGNDCSGGEMEIEKLLAHEVEIRRKDLLPVFEQFRSSQADWADRGLGAHQALSVERNQASDKFIKDACNVHSKSTLVASGLAAGLSWTGTSLIDSNEVCMAGPRRPISLLQSGDSIPQKAAHSPNLMSEDENMTPSPPLTCRNTSAIMPRKYSEEDCVSNRNSPMDECVINGIASSHASNKGLSSEVSSAYPEQNGPADSHSPPEFTQYFHEGYCKVSELDDCRDSTEAVTDADADSSSSHCEREKPDEYGDNDDMLGGVFDFSEEG